MGACSGVQGSGAGDGGKPRIDRIHNVYRIVRAPPQSLGTRTVEGHSCRGATVDRSDGANGARVGGDILPEFIRRRQEIGTNGDDHHAEPGEFRRRR